MPYTTSYVDDGKGVHKTGSGLITSSEIYASALEAGLNEARARKLKYGLIDFSDTTDIKVTSEDMHLIVEMNRKLAALTPGAFVAIVAPSPLPYAMARLWLTIADDLPWKANIFRTRADAIAWLRKAIILHHDSSDALEQFPSLKSNS